MRTLFIRKKIANFSNKKVDELLQRVVKASDSLKIAAFTKLVSDFNKSAKEFHNLRMKLPTTEYTQKINEISKQADDNFRMIKMIVDYNAMCQKGDLQTNAKKFKTIIAFYGNIPFTGIVKKFADYDLLVSELSKDAKIVTALKLNEFLTAISTLTKSFRQECLNRDNYRFELKGKRKAARQVALNDYSNLRDSVEAYAKLNGIKDVSNFIGVVNEALTYVCLNTNKTQE